MTISVPPYQSQWTDNVYVVESTEDGQVVRSYTIDRELLMDVLYKYGVKEKYSEIIIRSAAYPCQGPDVCRPWMSCECRSG